MAILNNKRTNQLMVKNENKILFNAYLKLKKINYPIVN